MVAFLEKHFEFTTALSLDECVARLETQSKRGSGWLASKRDVLVRLTDDTNGKKFELNRDVGRSLYAEVQGQLRKDKDGLVRVNGFGRVPLVIFLLIAYFFPASFFFGYALRIVPLLSALLFLTSILPLVFLFMTIRNRNDLIRIVCQTLNDEISH